MSDYSQSFYHVNRDEQRLAAGRNFAVRTLTDLAKRLQQPITIPQHEDPVVFFNHRVDFRYYVEARKLDKSLADLLKWTDKNPLHEAVLNATENSAKLPMIIFTTKSQTTYVAVGEFGIQPDQYPKGMNGIFLRVYFQFPVLLIFKASVYFKLLGHTISIR